MATFTMELRMVVKLCNIGMHDYPIFDEGYRPLLNRKIVDHYWYQEIGVETPDMFVFMLNRKMREIMPLYNQLYLSERVKFDPLSTVDISTLSSGTSDTKNTGTGTSHSVTEADSNSRAVSSTTPQTQLSGNGDYADNLSDSVGKTTSKGDSSENSDSEQKSSAEQNSRTNGRQGSAAALLMEWRSAMLNIDMLVVNDLSGLFMGLWNNQDHEPNALDVLPLYGPMNYGSPYTY